MRNKTRRTDTGVTVDFTGVLVSDADARLYLWMGEDYTAPADIADAIGMAGGRPITIRMNSVGGDLHAGAEIYTRLMEYPGQVNVDILSISASASSVVAMVSAKVGNRCRISPLGAMVIHNVQTRAEGDYREMEATAETLKKANEAIVGAYQKKTGMDAEKLQEMLDKETWLTAAQAVELGFADEVMFQEGDQPVAPETMTAIMAGTRTLVNAIPRLDAAAVRRMMEDQAQQKAKEEADEAVKNELQMAEMELELEENRF